MSANTLNYFRHIVLHLILATIITTGIAQEVSPGDGIRLAFYNITDEISGDYFIQTNGTIQFPYIGIIQTDDRTYTDIRDEIFTKFSEFYRDPELTIQPLYKINVLGEVTRPGTYYFTGVEKLSDLLAAAGGETRHSNLNNIALIRGDQKIKIRAKEILTEGKLLNDLGLQSGDKVYVPKKKLSSFRNASVVISAMALIVTAIRFL